MKIQEACDRLTELCHQGHAQARLMFISGADVKEVENFEMLGDDTVLVRSQIKWPGPPQPKKTVEACELQIFNEVLEKKLSQAKEIIMNLRNIITSDITIIDTEEKGSFFKQAVEFLKEETK